MATATLRSPVVTPPAVYEYVEVIRSCDAEYTGDCAYAYAEPHYSSKQLVPLRKGTVFYVRRAFVVAETLWYEVEFNEWVRYPRSLLA